MAKLDPEDPAYWMLERGRRDPSFRSRPQVYRPGCYICEDEEFYFMGLSLCRPCKHCEVAGDSLMLQPGHIPADDDECEDCGWSDNPNNPRHYVLNRSIQMP